MFHWVVAYRDGVVAYAVPFLSLAAALAEAGRLWGDWTYDSVRVCRKSAAGGFDWRIADV